MAPRAQNGQTPVQADQEKKPDAIEAPLPDVIHGPNGQPFATVEAATADLVSRGLDPIVWRAVPYGAGFALANSNRAPQLRTAVRESEHKGLNFGSATPTPDGSKVLTLENCEYLRIQVRPGRDGEDPQVDLRHNGDVLRVHRGVETIIPRRFISCLNDSVVRKHIIRPGVGRKFVGHVTRHDFSVLGPATVADYRRMRDAGAQIQEQEMMTAALAAAGQQRLQGGG